MHTELNDCLTTPQHKSKSAIGRQVLHYIYVIILYTFKYFYCTFKCTCVYNVFQCAL